jgi:hypothetical protein
MTSNIREENCTEGNSLQLHPSHHRHRVSSLQYMWSERCYLISEQHGRLSTSGWRLLIVYFKWRIHSIVPK